MPYKELVGALIFVMYAIAFSIACLSQYFSAPRAPAALGTSPALHGLLLMSTANYGIRLGAGGPDELKLITFSDSDWAGNPITCRSVGGYSVFFGTSILCWSSKTQRGLIN